MKSYVLHMCCIRLPSEREKHELTGAAIALGSESLSLPQCVGKDLKEDLFLEAPSMEILTRFHWYLMFHHAELQASIIDVIENDN